MEHDAFFFFRFASDSSEEIVGAVPVLPRFLSESYIFISFSDIEKEISLPVENFAAQEF